MERSAPETSLLTKNSHREKSPLNRKSSSKKKKKKKKKQKKKKKLEYSSQKQMHT